MVCACVRVCVSGVCVCVWACGREAHTHREGCVVGGVRLVGARAKEPVV